MAAGPRRVVLLLLSLLLLWLAARAECPPARAPGLSRAPPAAHGGQRPREGVCASASAAAAGSGRSGDVTRAPALP